jgi:hypothetical protein
MLTAAVRDLHRCHPGAFLTDVRSPHPELWENNPWLTPHQEDDSRVEVIDCHYPLINWSDRVPYHNLHGYMDFLNDRLNLQIHATEFKADIHLSRRERGLPSPIRPFAGRQIPYWLIAAGGKRDITIKWWDPDRYQQVVDQFSGRIQFIQVGAAGDYHPALRGAIDLRGRTTVRELIRLVHHAQGVVCGVTSLMHLAAAVPTPASRNPRPPLRPCVVIAGGREPVHWEAYPGHQLLHTIGALPCCAHGGCWRSRTVPLGDGGPGDRKQRLCLDVVRGLPRCMDMITAEMVIERIESYFQGGASRYLTGRESASTQRTLRSRQRNRTKPDPMPAWQVRPELDRFLRNGAPSPRVSGHQSIVLAIRAGTPRERIRNWIRNLRTRQCLLPVRVVHLNPAGLISRFEPSPVDSGVLPLEPCGPKSGGQQALAGTAALLLRMPYREILWLSLDGTTPIDFKAWFEHPGFRRTGTLFPRSIDDSQSREFLWRLCGLRRPNGKRPDLTRFVIDRIRCWDALCLAAWLVAHEEFFPDGLTDESAAFQLAFRVLGRPLTPRNSRLDRRKPGGLSSFA